MEYRVLILAPTGKDGKLIQSSLERAKLDCHVCGDVTELTDELGKAAGAVLVAEEALTKQFISSFTQHLNQQHAWSDLPVLVLSKRGLDAPDMRTAYLALGNATLLERPLRSVTLVSAVSSALRARRRQYEMRDVDRRKDEFLAMLAHELRNPLAPISAASELLRLVKLDQRRLQETSEVISRQVRHMTGLIDDLLDVSRVSRGLITLEKTPLDARQIVDDAVEQVRPLIDHKRHSLAIQFTHDSAVVIGDRKRLVQVLANLLNNAAKYSPEGSNIALKVQVDHGNVVFVVADDGIGMAEHVVGGVFDMFSQAERTPDRAQGGLGIGLALVKNLVELHGGTVTAHSDGVAKGSRFTVMLPGMPDSRSSTQSVYNVSAVRETEGLRLMVVDDNVDAARMLAMLLEAAGHEVVVEHSAKAALERSLSARPAACLLDIGLPDMDGNELASRLRAQSATSNAVLVAITGYGQQEDQTKSMESGFNHHLVKPVNMEELLALLAAIPGGRT